MNTGQLLILPRRKMHKVFVSLVFVAFNWAILFDSEQIAVCISDIGISSG